MISNDEISNNFSLLAKLMDIHGENPFKAKSYAAAAFSVDKVPTPLSEMPKNSIFSIKGIGESAGNRIIEMLQTGKLQILEDIIQNTLPILKKKKLTNRVDIFIEKNFFEKDAGKKYLAEFQKQGFDITIHANQLSQSGGAELAIELKAKSADHVIQLSDETIQSFGKSEVVTVLLPAADLYMKCDYPQARKLIDAGATVALATDFNPGTSPTQDLMLVGLLARLKMGMTLPEVFQAYTINAARALGLDAEEGSLEVGKKANFICTEADLTDFFYSAGAVPKHHLFIGGKQVKV